VILLSNIDSCAGLVNGAQGSIVGFEDFDFRTLPGGPENGEEGIRGDYPQYAQWQIRSFALRNGRPSWPIVQFDNGIKRTIYPECPVTEIGDTNEDSDRSKINLLSRTQIPLMAGYAITVHKFQGMTLGSCHR